MQPARQLPPPRTPGQARLRAELERRLAAAGPGLPERCPVELSDGRDHHPLLALPTTRAQADAIADEERRYADHRPARRVFVRGERGA